MVDTILPHHNPNTLCNNEYIKQLQMNTSNWPRIADISFPLTVTDSNVPSETPSLKNTIRFGNALSCAKFLVASVAVFWGSWVNAIYRDTYASREATSEATKGIWTPGSGWDTSAPAQVKSWLARNARSNL